jgi:PTS system galactitol-specific IIA component
LEEHPLASDKIIELLVTSAICLQLDSPDSKTVIETLSGCLLEAGIVHASFAQAALDRESRMPTGLPLGGKFNAAIPHTDIEHVIKPGLALATLKHPVNFQNMIEPETAVPVQLVILMALEQAKTQVEMLQEIAGVLQDEIIIEKLMQAGDIPQVYEAFS